ncbi:hypothetical protein NDU88_007896 [Pleurodeles waltl]|uniref:Uncharacterized protein n=1 Tax=Pleurodeles waltl TaxID=8319 RepID=A0AAV7N6P4_PLEWA|nr:hypothetical protein NDU88_007896 [Pleurodeles waltl]
MSCERVECCGRELGKRRAGLVILCIILRERRRARARLSWDQRQSTGLRILAFEELIVGKETRVQVVTHTYQRRSPGVRIRAVGELSVGREA